MKTTRTIATAALSAALLAGLACGEDEAPTDPTAPNGGGETVTLAVTLATPNADDGAILFTLSGGAVEAPAAASPDHRLYTRAAGETSLTLALVGDLEAGTLVEFEIPEGASASDYAAAILEVADRGNALREDLDTYGLTVEAP